MKTDEAVDPSAVEKSNGNQSKLMGKVYLKTDKSVNMTFNLHLFDQINGTSSTTTALPCTTTE